MVDNIILFIKDVLQDLFNNDYDDEIIYDHNDEINYIGSDYNE